MPFAIQQRRGSNPCTAFMTNQLITIRCRMCGLPTGDFADEGIAHMAAICANCALVITPHNFIMGDDNVEVEVTRGCPHCGSTELWAETRREITQYNDHWATMGEDGTVV